MHLIRFVDAQGRIQYGQNVDAEHARPITGCIFGEHSIAKDPVRIVRRLAPCEPPNIIAIGRNYRDHAKEMASTADETEPLVFLKLTSSIIGPDESIELPSQAPDEVDYEGELAVVIGRTARRVSEADALAHIFGYTCANDVSARDCQKRRDKQWARGKSFDTFCPLGPHIVTRDECGDGPFTVRSYLNGQLMQNGSTAELIFPIAHLVSYLSHQFTLRAGTVILSGTPAGVGAARNPPVFLREGDLIEVDISGIGRLSSPVRRGGQ